MDERLEVAVASGSSVFLSAPTQDSVLFWNKAFRQFCSDASSCNLDHFQMKLLSV